MAEHVVGGLDRTGHRQNDASLVGFGDAAGALADLAFDGVGLAEVRPACIKDDRLPAAQLVIEDFRKPRVPAFGHPCRHLRGLVLFRVIVDVEMFCFQYTEIEFLVLHFVAAEVATLRERRSGNTQQREQGC